MEITECYGQPVAVLDHNGSKKDFFFLLVFSLCLLPCLLSLETTTRSPTLLPYRLPQQIFIYIDKISSSFLKINYFWVPLGLLEYIPICMEEPTAGFSIPSPVLSRGRVTSFGVLIALLLMQQRMQLNVFVARAPVQPGT